MTHRKPVVALILPANSAYSRELTEGVIDRHLRARDWLIIDLPRYEIGQSPLPARRFHLDGVITWAEPRDSFVLELVGSGVPVVNCGMEWGGLDGVMRVHTRHEDLHQEVIRHFTALGLRHAVILSHNLAHRPATAGVLQSFVKLATHAGLEARMWDVGGVDSPSTSPRRVLEYADETELAAFLTELPKPAGIYCTGDHMGFLVSLVARHAGLRVPQDLAIMGLGGNTIAALADPPLTSVATPARKIGFAAAEQLARWLDAGRRPAEEIVVPGAVLTLRESTVGLSGQVELEALRRLIAERAATGMDLGELVRQSKLSAKTLVRRYEEAFGIKPLDEIQQLRIAEAKRLLTTELPVAEVAARCGFTSQAGLYNYFKRHTGVAPSDFRGGGIPAE